MSIIIITATFGLLFAATAALTQSLADLAAGRARRKHTQKK